MLFRDVMEFLILFIFHYMHCDGQYENHELLGLPFVTTKLCFVAVDFKFVEDVGLNATLKSE